MRPFEYVRAADEERAVASGAERGTKFLAGGTNLVDLMKIGVEEPARLVDLAALPLSRVDALEDGVRIGAMVRNTELAYHPLIVAKYPVLSQAILAGASPQLRNLATVGGNLLQRTRCPYFRDVHERCNKRKPGTGCAAWDGYNRSNAVLGGSPDCIATNPSDMNVALAALDAVVLTRGPRGERRVPFAQFHVLPGARPDVETVLAPGELITHVQLPNAAFYARSRYLKVRDRASFDFALASAAVALDLDGKTIRGARVAFGGVGTKPWRSADAEQALTGGRADDDALFAHAADAAMREAVGRPWNAFKIELAKRTLVRVLRELGGAA